MPFFLVLFAVAIGEENVYYESWIPALLGQMFLLYINCKMQSHPKPLGVPRL